MKKYLGLSYRKSLLFIIFIISAITTSAQESIVKGKVLDYKSKKVIANATVFIPYTSIGTTTDHNGEFALHIRDMGQFEVECRHLSYKVFNQTLNLEHQKNIEITINLHKKLLMIQEVIKEVRIPSWDLSYRLFMKYFLGDQQGRSCKLLNPEVLLFYHEGEALMAIAKEPLQIQNKYLGYKILYFLDFFKYVEDNGGNLSVGVGDYYAYDGSALFEDDSGRYWLRKATLEANRMKEYVGRRKHFLTSLYLNIYENVGYRIRKAWQGYDDIQYKMQWSTAMLKLETIQIDSIFTWDSKLMKPTFLYYFPNKPYLIDTNFENQSEHRGCMHFSDTLLIFYDPHKTESINNDIIATFSLPVSKCQINEYGEFDPSKGRVNWKNLDNMTTLVNMLPSDFKPSEKKRTLSK